MSKYQYQAIMFAGDGDWVVDHRRETVEEVWNAVNDQGSRWFFYPFAAVTTSKGSLTTGYQRIVDAPEEYSEIRGLSINTASRWVANNSDVLACLWS